MQAFKIVFVSWQYWLRLGVGFLVPYLLFSTIMQQAAVQIDLALDNIDIEPKVAILQADSIPAPLLEAIESAANIQTVADQSSAEALIDKDSLDVLIQGVSGQAVALTYDLSKNDRAIYAVLNLVDNYEDELVAASLDSLGVTASMTDPLRVNKNNLFSPMTLMGDISEQIKNSLANILNFLFLVFILWMIRSMLLRQSFLAPNASIPMVLLAVFVGTLLAMGAIFVGFQMGVSTDEQGLIQNLVFSINQLLVWNNLSSMLWLWWPTWLFIIAFFGSVIYAFPKRIVRAHNTSYWLVIGWLIVGLVAMFPTTQMTLMQYTVPVVNVFGVGQLSMKEGMESGAWWITLGISIAWVVGMVFIWMQVRRRASKAA